MNVILLERIENLGHMGDEVTVRPGHARNYLLPQRMALRATEENRAYFQRQRAELEARNRKRREEAESYGERLQGLRVIMVRQAGEKGQLYGSVTARDIAEEIREMGYTIRRDQVRLSAPVKEIGVYDVRLGLHPEVHVDVQLHVVRNKADAEAAAAGDTRAVVEGEEPSLDELPAVAEGGEAGEAAGA